MGDIIRLVEWLKRRPSMTKMLLEESLDSFEAVGAWFLTIFCLAVMGVTVHVMTSRAPVLFYLLVTYATALSLVLTSPFHTLFTRHLADKIYLGRFHDIVNSLMALTILVTVPALLLAAALVVPFSSIEVNLKITFIGLTAVLSLFWCIGTVLSSIRRERLLLKLFGLGMGTTLILFGATRMTDTQALLLFFSVGVAIPAAGGYSYVVKLYLRMGVRLDGAFLRRPQARRIGLSAFLFMFGFWVDKLIFWFHPGTGKSVDGVFHFYGEYDFPFFAALTIMMVGSLIIYKGIKRSINGPYERFIFKLSNNFPFRDLAVEKERLFSGIAQTSSSLFLFYGGACMLVLFLVHIGIVPIPWSNPFVFHYLLTGTIFFSLYFFYFLIIQYLDEYDLLLKLNGLFCLLNAVFTLLSIEAGWRFQGTGFLAASFVVAAAGFFLVNRIVGGLEYQVFRRASELRA
jgi:polysaccharide biosynthesis protein PelG